MKFMLKILSLAGILMTIVPPVLYFLGKLSHSAQNTWMIAGTVVWFATASLWLGRKKETGKL